MQSVSSQEVDPAQVAAILTADLADVDRADPTLLYTRTVHLIARYNAVLAELALLRADAVERLHDDGQGMSLRKLGTHLGISGGRVQQLIERAHTMSPVLHLNAEGCAVIGGPAQRAVSCANEPTVTGSAPRCPQPIQVCDAHAHLVYNPQPIRSQDSDPAR
jgi:hypothetical protein